MQDLMEVMIKKAKLKPARIVVCEGWEMRCLQASAELLKENISKIILLGSPDEINAKAKELNVDISKAEIHDYKNSDKMDALVKTLVELRGHKGVTEEKAKQLLQDVNYFGCMYAYAGYADAVAGSAIGSTAELMRPALQILRKKDSLVSEVAILRDVKNDRYLIGTDFSMNINPTPLQLAQMGANAVKIAKSFDFEPRVAFLSFSTKGSGGDGSEIQVVRDAVEEFKKIEPGVLVDGELQVDAAVNPDACMRKCPDSPLKGNANVLVFPNLTASNILVHSMFQFSDMDFAATINEGMQRPVAILGRSTSKDVIKNMMIGLAMQVNSSE